MTTYIGFKSTYSCMKHLRLANMYVPVRIINKDINRWLMYHIIMIAFTRKKRRLLLVQYQKWSMVHIHLLTSIKFSFQLVELWTLECMDEKWFSITYECSCKFFFFRLFFSAWPDLTSRTIATYRSASTTSIPFDHFNSSSPFQLR